MSRGKGLDLQARLQVRRNRELKTSWFKAGCADEGGMEIVYKLMIPIGCLRNEIPERVVASL